MSPRNLTVAAAYVIALSWSGGVVRAQIQQQNLNRLSDVNPQIGSGGINLPGPGPLINRGNLVVSGNVTGGRSFQGFSPVRNSSQFFVDIPSAGLSNFRRDTVGVQDALGGVNTLYRPRPYFSVPQTITNSGAIANGLNLPGTSIPRDVYQIPYTDLQLPQPQLMAPISPQRGDSRLETGSYLQQPLTDLDGGGLYGGGSPGESAARSWIEGSDLFSDNAYLRRRRREDMLSLLDTLRARQSAELGLQLDERRDMRLDPSVDMRLDTRISAGLIDYGPEDAGEAPSERYAYMDYSLPGSAALPVAGSSLIFREVGTGEPSTGRAGGGSTLSGDRDESAITGLIEADEHAARRSEAYRAQYDAQRRAELLETAIPHLSVGSSAAEAASAEPGRKALPGELSLPVSDGEPPSTGRGTQFAHLNPDDVTTLAGGSDPRSNALLAHAEELMRAGQYFRAAGQYEIAGVLAPSSPLPDIGRAHALIAAGEYYTAVKHLARGIQAWPGFANFRIDLTSFITDADLLDRRRADLEQFLTQGENYEFRFLLGYIEYYMRLEEFGLDNLDKAAAGAPPDSFIAGFPDLIRQGLQADTGLPEANP